MTWRLQVYDSLHSTSDICIKAAEAGEPAGLAVLARTQTAGRGSRGQHWYSPVGNLYFSVLLRPQRDAAQAGLWSLLAAVALREALGGAPINLKWPNDLMLDGGKLAGILLDSAGEGGRLDWLVIGFGANLAIAPEVAGRETRALGRGTAEDVAEALLWRLDHWQARGLAAAREAWLAASWPIGTAITLARPAITGTFRGLSEAGCLLVGTSEGVLQVVAGEVVAE